MSEVTVLIVPGLRDHVPEHWQTLLAARLPRVHMVEPMGREDLDCARKVAAIEREANAIKGPLLLVAHSGGVIMVAHWAKQTQRVVHGALLATPPDFERAMPTGYPTIKELRAGGWLPVPRNRLPFRSIVAASRKTIPWAGLSAWLSSPMTGAANWSISVKSGTSTRHPATANGRAPSPSFPN